MPTQLPLESTDLFGDLLLPHTADILQSDAKKPLESHKFSFPVHSVIQILLLKCVEQREKQQQLLIAINLFLNKK